MLVPCKLLKQLQCISASVFRRCVLLVVLVAVMSTPNRHCGLKLDDFEKNFSLSFYHRKNLIFLLFSPEIDQNVKVWQTSHKGEPIVVKQGKELKAFWSALGRDPLSFEVVRHLKRPVKTRMFLCSSSTGILTVTEVYNFAQADLSPENVYIIDAVNEVYVWKGPWSNESDVQHCMKIAVEYVEKAFDGRLQSTPVKVRFADFITFSSFCGSMILPNSSH